MYAPPSPPPYHISCDSFSHWLSQNPPTSRVGLFLPIPYEFKVCVLENSYQINCSRCSSKHEWCSLENCCSLQMLSLSLKIQQLLTALKTKDCASRGHISLPLSLPTSQHVHCPANMPCSLNACVLGTVPRLQNVLVIWFLFLSFVYYIFDL